MVLHIYSNLQVEDGPAKNQQTKKEGRIFQSYRIRNVKQENVIGGKEIYNKNIREVLKHNLWWISYVLDHIFPLNLFIVEKS